MRLTELDPRWILDEAGRRVGFVFRSPTKQTEWQTCFQRPTPPSRRQYELVGRLFGADEEDREDGMCDVQFCKPTANWTITPALEGATFDQISVTPSLDGSAGGLWHGYITNGQIVGGI